MTGKKEKKWEFNVSLFMQCTFLIKFNYRLQYTVCFDLSVSKIT